MENEQELKLKARAFDLIAMNEQIQRELSVINQELRKLNEEKKKQPINLKKNRQK